MAAVEDERVRVFVTDERQTAIVTNGAYILLDWFRWVTETLGDSAINATYTIRSTELDEDGEPEEEAEEVESSDRIEVEFESDEDEYYVKISRVIAREMDDEDPDRAIYELEACVPQPDGSEQCYKSNITVFAIQVVELQCFQPPGSRLLTITCFSPGNELDSNANCSFDGGPAFSCERVHETSLLYAYEMLEKGNHTKIIYNIISRLVAIKKRQAKEATNSFYNSCIIDS